MQQFPEDSLIQEVPRAEPRYDDIPLDLEMKKRRPGEILYKDELTGQLRIMAVVEQTAVE